MYKALIVDDDLLARMGMKALIDWRQHGFEVIGTADNGEHALELMERELPDVVFTDVVMHGMDGIELTRQIKRRYPDVLVVALSCYTDVDYVKNIIRMGAEDYLQKLSMRPEDIVAMLRTLSAKLEARVSAVPNGTDARRNESFLTMIRDRQGRNADLRILGFEPEQGVRLFAIRIIVDSVGAMQCLAKAETACQIRGMCWARYREDLLAAIVPDAPQPELESMAEKLLEEARGEAVPIPGLLCMGVSQAFTNADELRTRFCQAGEASLATYVNPQKRVFFHHTPDGASMETLYAQHARITRLLEEGDWAGVSEALPAFTCGMKNLESRPVLCRRLYTSLFSRLTQLTVIHDVEVEIPGLYVEKMACVEESQQAFLTMLSSLSARFVHLPRLYRQEVKQVMAYIDTHYSEDITLARLAAHAAMSESHLSSIFKKETGKGIINYLEEVRIARATQLMLSSRQPLYAIARQVGYANVNYFSRVFKKVRGETPSQFMKRQKNIALKTKNIDVSDSNGK